MFPMSNRDTGKKVITVLQTIGKQFYYDGGGEEFYNAPVKYKYACLHII